MNCQLYEYYSRLNERENWRDKMRMARNYDSERKHASFKREFRKARNRLVAFKRKDNASNKKG